MALDLKKGAIIAGVAITLATFIMMWVNSCGGGTAGSDSHKLDEISSKIDSIAASTDVLEEYAQETHKVVTRTEKRVEKVQETVDSTWNRVECNLPPCGGQPATKSKPTPRDTNNHKPESKPCKSDTVYVVIYEPKPDVDNKPAVGVVDCEVVADPYMSFSHFYGKHKGKER